MFPINVGSRVSCTIGGKLYLGTIIGIQGSAYHFRADPDQYAYRDRRDKHSVHREHLSFLEDPPTSFDEGDRVEVFVGLELVEATILKQISPDVFTVAFDEGEAKYGWRAKDHKADLEPVLQRLGRKLDGTNCWNIATTNSSQDKILRVIKPAKSQAKPQKGDRVLVEIFRRDGSIFDAAATFLGHDGEHNRDLVYLDKPFSGDIKGGTVSSWKAGYADQLSKILVQELGLDTQANRCWHVDGSQSRITWISKETKEKGKEMAKVNLKSLIRGDRILVQLKDREGFTHEVEATVVLYESNGNIQIYVDEDISGISQMTAYRTADISANTTTIVKEMGLDTALNRILQFPQNYSYAQVTKVLKNASKKEETGKANVMEKKEQGFGDMLMSDLKNAGWRTGATQMTNAVQSGILLMLKEKHGMDDGKLAVIKEMLGTSMGHAIIEWVLGSTLTFVPGIKEDPRVKRLAEEMRIGGMAEGMNEVIGAGVVYVMPGIHAAIQALPPIEEAIPAVFKPARKKRVATHSKPRVTASDKSEAIQQQAEEEAQADNKKSATA